MTVSEIFTVLIAFTGLAVIVSVIVYAYNKIPIVRSAFKLLGILFFFTYKMLRPILNYIEKEVFSGINKLMGPSSSTGLSQSDWDDIGAESQRRRREALDAEERARRVAEQARQSQRHQDAVRARQAQADAERARARVRY